MDRGTRRNPTAGEMLEAAGRYTVELEREAKFRSRIISDGNLRHHRPVAMTPPEKFRLLLVGLEIGREVQDWGSKDRPHDCRA
jgi:hypothetical protein